MSDSTTEERSLADILAGLAPTTPEPSADELRELDRHDTLAAAEQATMQARRAEAEKVAVAAHWGDLHSPDALPPAVDDFEAFRRRQEGTVGVLLGGIGTPEVMTKAPSELGVVLRTSTGGASALMADALDLRHRLPGCWTALHQGRAEAWKARQVARATRGLTQAAAAVVDAAVAPYLDSLPWTRFQNLLEATIKRADEAAATAEEQRRATDRYVRLGRITDAHLRSLSACGDVLDVTVFAAMVDRIAAILAAQGDPDPIDVRRSKALGILGRPDHATQLLAQHRTDTDEPELPTDPDPDEPDPDETGPNDDDETGPTPATPMQRSTGPARVQLYVHLTDAVLRTGRGIARIEGHGPVTLDTLRRLLGDHQRPGREVAITVRPVLDPTAVAPVDCYEIPTRTAEAVRLLHPHDVFPYGTTRSRSCDLDHTTAYRLNGPPGQTAPDRLGPLARGHHNDKTHRGHQLRQPWPGIYLWRTPHGWIGLVTPQGTHVLGHGPREHALWDAVSPPRAALTTAA